MVIGVLQDIEDRRSRNVRDMLMNQGTCDPNTSTCAEACCTCFRMRHSMPMRNRTLAEHGYIQLQGIHNLHDTGQEIKCLRELDRCT